MEKTYKISYKTYFNDRLKKIDFHEKPTYPLYVQVTFERKTIFFKSYFFELLSKSRYRQFVNGKKLTPSINDIIKKEEELIDFIIDKNKDAFSLDLFKEEYAYYSKDLCDVTALNFGLYMFMFFFERKMPALGKALGGENKSSPLYDIVEEMKMVLQPSIYNEMIEKSFPYGVFGAPYLLLYGFMKQVKKPPMLLLTVMEWESIKTKAKFAEYALKYYADKDAGILMALIDERIAVLKKEGK